MKKKTVIDAMKTSASAEGVYEGWTNYFMKWSGFAVFLELSYCPLRRYNRLLIALITVPYNSV